MVVNTYLTVGLDNLDKKYFDPIDNSVFFKPICGLWATKQKDDIINYNEWMDYLVNKDTSTFFYKYQNYNFNIPAVFFTLKKQSKIYYIKSIKDLLSIMSAFPNKKDTWWHYKSKIPNLYYIDYEKVSNLYDGVFFDITSLFEEAQGDLLIEKDIINSFSVNTLILFNLDCIEYYQQTTIEVTPFECDYKKSRINCKINISDEKQFVSDSRTDDEIRLIKQSKYKFF